MSTYSSIDKLDPYTAQAPNDTMTPQEKVAGLARMLTILSCLLSNLGGCFFSGLREIIHATQTAMLTTRSADGQIHSRAMNPVSRRFRLYIYMR